MAKLNSTAPHSWALLSHTKYFGKAHLGPYYRSQLSAMTKGYEYPKGLSHMTLKLVVPLACFTDVRVNYYRISFH